MSHSPDAFYNIAVVCAIPFELARLRKTGTMAWTELPSRKDHPEPVTYWATEYRRPSGPSLRVVAACPRQMGMPASAILTTKMVLRFRPSLVAHVGIAAGVEGFGRDYGDVLAPDHTFDYGAGKISGSDEKKLAFSPDPRPIAIYPLLHERLQFWKNHMQREFDEIRTNWDGTAPNTPLKLHIGPLGSGAAVIAKRRTVDQIRDHWRKLIGVEMEAYGVHLACQDVVHPPPMFLCMKAVCDFADAKKSDDWQPYAAHTAAQLFYRFVVSEWERLFPQTVVYNETIEPSTPPAERNTSDETRHAAATFARRPADLAPAVLSAGDAAPPDTVRVTEPKRSQNPFHPAGSLPAGHKTYIARECDRAFFSALETSPLITIEGAPASGKSSLALTAVAAMSKSHQVCYLDLQDSRTDDDNAFMRFFFEEIAEQLSRPVSNWSHINGKAGQPSTIIIDEIGFLNTQIARSFIPQLVQFTTRNSAQARVVVCLPLQTAGDSFNSFLKGIGISHAKYRSNWHKISVSPFTAIEIGVLLDVLSDRARQIAREQIKTVAEISSGNPRAIQCLCSRLWDSDGKNSPTSELYSIIKSPGAYE